MARRAIAVKCALSMENCPMTQALVELSSPLKYEHSSVSLSIAYRVIITLNVRRHLLLSLCIYFMLNHLIDSVMFTNT